MSSKYYCQKCGHQVKPSDTICPNCGADLSKVGRNIRVEITETIGFSDSVYASLTIRQKKIIEKVFKALKDEFDKAEIESVTLGFPQLISIKITKKKKNSEQK